VGGLTTLVLLGTVEEHSVGKDAAHVHAQDRHDGNVSGRATLDQGSRRP